MNLKGEETAFGAQQIHRSIESYQIQTLLGYINAPERGASQPECARCEKHKAYSYSENDASKRILLCKLSLMAMAFEAPFASSP